jgi:nicotinamide phosphoribosyltransferase
VKEGTVLAPSNVMVQVTNTTGLPSRWLTSFIETSILRGVWYPTTVATLSREIKKLIKKYLEETGTPELLNYKLHDFGFRGVSSYESGCIGALAHLVNFRGSDTMGANVYGKAFYKERTAGTSIPAAEHSTITSWGTENEAKAYRNMIEKFGGPGKMYAVVSDSYDIYNAVSEIWGKELQAEVRAKGGVLVVRPDSGHPATVVLEVVKALGDAFGYEENAKGYKVLDPCVRVIQGDGINIDSIEEILETLKTSGWSADNVAFGMGGALLQKMDRDTFSFAMKASAISYDDGETWGDVKKNPITQALKKSKGGRLALIKEDGKTYRTQTLEEIRKLAEV